MLLCPPSFSLLSSSPFFSSCITQCFLFLPPLLCLGIRRPEIDVCLFPFSFVPLLLSLLFFFFFILGSHFSFRFSQKMREWGRPSVCLFLKPFVSSIKDCISSGFREKEKERTRHTREYYSSFIKREITFYQNCFTRHDESRGDEKEGNRTHFPLFMLFCLSSSLESLIFSGCYIYIKSPCNGPEVLSLFLYPPFLVFLQLYLQRKSSHGGEVLTRTWRLSRTSEKQSYVTHFPVLFF